MYLNIQKYGLFCSLIESLSRICPACVASVIDSGSPVRESELRNPGNSCLWNGGILSFGIRKTAQGIWNPKMIGIQIPSSTDDDWNPVPRIRNPRHWIQNSRLSSNPLHGARVRFCRRGRHSLGEALLSPPRPQYALTWWSRPAATWATRTSRVRCPSFVKNLVRP